MEYCLEHGFKAGKNFKFKYDSGYPIDLSWPWLISVRDNVTLASNVKLLAHDTSTTLTGVHTKIGIVKSGNNVFVGVGSIVLCNTRIGDNVIVRAGSVVTNDIPSNSVYACNPAVFICTFEEYKEKHQESQKTPHLPRHTWQQWPNAPENERTAMRKKLEHTFGYF